MPLLVAVQWHRQLRRPRCQCSGDGDLQALGSEPLVELDTSLFEVDEWLREVAMPDTGWLRAVDVDTGLADCDMFEWTDVIAAAGEVRTDEAPPQPRKAVGATCSWRRPRAPVAPAASTCDSGKSGGGNEGRGCDADGADGDAHWAGASLHVGVVAPLAKGSSKRPADDVAAPSASKRKRPPQDRGADHAYVRRVLFPE